MCDNKYKQKGCYKIIPQENQKMFFYYRSFPPEYIFGKYYKNIRTSSIVPLNRNNFLDNF